ncbi:MAG: glycosyltransferase [Planctomycetota bacterium]|nr:glycosyltransferase [Planctomycetota bacterium]
MQATKTSVLVGAYRDVEALELLLAALVGQTRLPDEVVIAEDGSDPGMASFVAGLDLPFPVLHTTGVDEGWTKNRSMNRAIRAATGDYLLLLDEDCPPLPGWVAGHLALARPGTILAGRRVDLGPGISRRLRAGELDPVVLGRRLLRSWRALAKDGGRHLEEGLAFPPGRFFLALQARLRKKAWLVGCNWSCFAADLHAINGFDEDFDAPCYGEDLDLERRFRLLGIQTRSARNVAGVLHLFHEKRFDEAGRERMRKLMESRPEDPRCVHGIVHLDQQAAEGHSTPR